MTDRGDPFVLHARTITSTGGGPEKTLLNSPRFLKKHGYDSACMFFHPPNDPGFQVQRERATKVGAPLVEVIDRSRFDITAIRTAIKYCRETSVDIWHAHDYKTNLLGLIARRFHPMKLITTAHGWVNFDGNTPRYYQWDKRWFLPRYEHVICVSETVQQQCLAAGLRQSKCHLIHNAIDTEAFRRTRHCNVANSDQLNFKDKTLVIGSIGRLSEEKGFDLLIDAFCKLLGNGVNAKLVIAGEGKERSALAAQIADAGMEHQIVLTGFQEDTRAFYESLDIFVLSSHREGLPNVLLEAMAVEVPVLATEVGGVSKVVEHDFNGILIQPGSVDEIYAGLSRLAECEALRRRLSEAGLKTIQQKWSFADRMKKIVQMYDQMLGS